MNARVRPTFWLWILTGISCIVALILYFADKPKALDFALGLFGVFAMLSIALETFIRMNKSSNETIFTILRSSQNQISELKSFVEELKDTNAILGKVATNLDIISEDVLARQKLMPSLSIAFTKGQKKIALTAGKIHSVDLELSNNGIVSATNAVWGVLIPPDIEVVEADSFKKVLQPTGAIHGGYWLLQVRHATIAPKHCFPYTIKIRTSSTNVGPARIPFLCSCDGTPQNEGQLQIDFIG